MDELSKKLKDFGAVKPGAKMSRFTTFKIGGKVRFLVIIGEVEKLTGLLNFLRAEGVDYFVVGGGSNLLWSDEDFEGVVIKVNCQKVKLIKDIIEAEAGASLGALVNLASQNSLSGLEWAIGIPGTVGGAARGNAGAMGQDMSKAVEKVEVWQDGEIVVLKNSECGFIYRGSGFKDGRGVILRVWLKLVAGDKLQILAKVQEYFSQRQGKFPPFASAGCFFKNIKLDRWPGDKSQLPPRFVERGMVPVGWVIEQAGLLGKKAGEAQVSNQHGSFIVNLGAAKAEDVLKLVEVVKGEVYNKFRVKLKPEVEVFK